MNSIQLSTSMPSNVTVISNDFLDFYMASANGEFLKIYLYLLRWAGNPDLHMTTSSIADFFNMTENDVNRAFRFWEQEQLLTIVWSGHDAVSIRLNPPVIPEISESAVTEVESEPDIHTTSVSEEKNVPEYSADDIAVFSNQKGVDELLNVIHSYMGKTLSPTDVNTIMFFYNELHMSVELIEYLFEYCVDNNHRKMSYIQTVALNWHREHIHTADQAKSYCMTFSRLNLGIMNAFGIKNRYFSDEELKYIRTWSGDYHFSQDLIEEACRRTIMTIHSASFQYADTILTRWHKNNVESFEDVKKLDEAFEKAKAAKAKQAQEQKGNKIPAKAASRFHNFNQRSYNYSDMEAQFMKKLHSDHNN